MNRQIAVQRMHNQRLSHSDFADPVEVVRWLGALQGQDYAGAKWSIGIRLPGSTDAQIEQAIDEHTIVRTWIMRGTLHLVAAADIHWMVMLVGERLVAQTQRRYHQLELDEATLLRSNDLIEKCLRDGTRLTRHEIFTILEAEGISAKGQRGVHMLQRASLDGLICQSITKSNVPTFVHIDTLPATASLSRAEALAELAKRFFQSRGPATLHDFARWGGLTITDSRAGLEAIESQLVSETIDGETYLRPNVPDPAPVPAAVMPPGFDEYVLGYKDRGAVLDPQYETHICPGKNGIFYPTIVLDGQIVGTWKRQFKKDKVIITLSPFQALSDADLKAIQPAAQHYADFYQRTAIVEQ